MFSVLWTITICNWLSAIHSPSIRTCSSKSESLVRQSQVPEKWRRHDVPDRVVNPKKTTAGRAASGAVEDELAGERGSL